MASSSWNIFGIYHITFHVIPVAYHYFVSDRDLYKNLSILNFLHTSSTILFYILYHCQINIVRDHE